VTALDARGARATLHVHQTAEAERGRREHSRRHSRSIGRPHVHRGRPRSVTSIGDEKGRADADGARPLPHAPIGTASRAEFGARSRAISLRRPTLRPQPTIRRPAPTVCTRHPVDPEPRGALGCRRSNHGDVVRHNERSYSRSPPKQGGPSQRTWPPRALRCASGLPFC
jgi:hypothetical protein